MRLATIITLTAIALAAGPARASDAVFDRAVAIIKAHKLLTRSELACSALMKGGETTADLADVSVIEKHGGGCPGDPDTSPRRFDLQIHLRSGKVTWDQNIDREQRPIP